MLVGLFVFVLLVGVVVMFHEAGQYLVGRWLLDISSSDLKIVLTSLPQHVALRNGDEWASPLDFATYQEAYHQYDPDSTHAVVFFSAGELAQTVGVVGLGSLFVLSGSTMFAQLLVLSSVMLTSCYWTFDIALYLHMGSLTGEFSALWARSPLSGAGLVVFFVAAHGGFYAVL